MDTVHEDYRIVFLQRAGKPVGDFFVHVFYHAGDAGFAVALAVDLVENLAHLTLGEPLRIQAASQPLALLLIPKDGKNLRVEVAVSVSRNPEFQTLAVPVRMPQTVAVSLVTIFGFTEECAPLCQHKALQHYLHQIVQAIFSLCMLAH